MAAPVTFVPELDAFPDGRLDDIAEATGLSVRHVREAIEPERLAPPDRRRRPDVEAGQVAELYAAGMTIQRIAAKFGCNQRTIEHRLAAAGIPRRQRWRLTPEVEAEPVKRFETRDQDFFCVSLVMVGLLIHATVSIFGSRGLRLQNRRGLAA